jgi:hypothetical protein
VRGDWSPSQRWKRESPATRSGRARTRLGRGGRPLTSSTGDPWELASRRLWCFVHPRGEAFWSTPLSHFGAWPASWTRTCSRSPGCPGERFWETGRGSPGARYSRAIPCPLPPDTKQRLIRSSSRSAFRSSSDALRHIDESESSPRVPNRSAASSRRMANRAQVVEVAGDAAVLVRSGLEHPVGVVGPDHLLAAVERLPGAEVVSEGPA